VRLGILGGSFDPPHVGHLLVAQDALDALQLDKVVFVPAGTQPLKAGAAGATPAQRLAMVRAMVAGDGRFEVSPIEVERPGLSFTVDTLREFAGRYPDAERYFLMGEDVLTTLAQWRDPGQVVQLATPVVLRRAGGTGDGAASIAGVPLRRLETRRFDVSSTEIRDRVRRGLSVAGFVADGVAAIIARDRLYQNG